MRFTVPDARITGVLFALGLIAAPVVQGQTLFGWPSRLTDVSSYTHVEDCLIAIRRVGDSVFHHSLVWPDTMPHDPREVEQPRSPVVIETARQCAARFVAKSVPLDSWISFAELFVLAGRIADAEQVYTRRIEEVVATGGGPATDTLRAAVTDSMIQLYWNARPILRTRASALLRAQLQRPGWSVWRRINLLAESTLLEDATVCGSGQAEFAKEIESALRQITDADRRLSEFDEFKAVRAQVLDCLSERALHDSLKRSTAGYVSLRKANWATANERGTDRWDLSVGERAPRIEANFWLSPQDTATPAAVSGPNPNASAGQRAIVPAPGRTSLLLFWDYRCYGNDDHPDFWGCLDRYAAVRRIAKQFPTLDITIVTKTNGYFWPFPPLDPADEAKMFKKLWLDFHKIPARLAVSVTEFWRLPDPDRRRINEPDVNVTNYSFGRENMGAYVFLIDPDGIVVEAGNLTRATEPQWQTLVKLLMARQGNTR